jgi:hypothetical protein
MSRTGKWHRPLSSLAVCTDVITISFVVTLPAVILQLAAEPTQMSLSVVACDTSSALMKCKGRQPEATANVQYDMPESTHFPHSHQLNDIALSACMYH